MDIVSSKNKNIHLKQKRKVIEDIKKKQMSSIRKSFVEVSHGRHVNGMSGFLDSKNMSSNKELVHERHNKKETKFSDLKSVEKKHYFDLVQEKVDEHKDKELNKVKTVRGKKNFSDKKAESLVDNSNNLFWEHRLKRENYSKIRKLKAEELSKEKSTKAIKIYKSKLKERFENKNEKAIKSKLLRKISINFGVVIFGLLLFVGAIFFVGDVMAIKDKIMSSKDEVIESTKHIVVSVRESDIDAFYREIENSYEILFEAQNDLRSIGRHIIWISRYIPVASKLASGDALLSAGVDLIRATELIIEYGKELKELNVMNEEYFNFLKFASEGLDVLDDINRTLISAQKQLEIVKIDDLPADAQKYVVDLRRILPKIKSHIKDVVKIKLDIEDMLGANGPRSYLFLFQNNQESRATGGFIGSYALLDILDGEIREFYVDGIFNPDGQLADKVVPPLPIQKISAAWSLHDSNWWPDFPKSAKVAMDFYERTGGRSVDGVVMITPTMMEKLLKITGPIYMKEYNVTLTSDNFVEKTQYKVEVDYDKEENKPKKILSDLIPLIVDKLKKDFSGDVAVKIMSMIEEGFDEKHIIMYAKNKKLQDYIVSHRWGGEIQETTGDYISVINTNINGYKTDGVIDQIISHNSEIKEDGSIIDTVTISREHRGGYTGKEWWDAVNANYMRVYVPKGSKLISATGHTREVNDERLSYDKIGFERYGYIKDEEKNTEIHEVSGTKIYSESDKTVFANWVYVSPQEKVHVTYVYKLPWKLKFKKNDDGRLISSHSLLMQKQSGSTNVEMNTTVNFPKNINIEWSTHEASEHSLNIKSDLDKDYYYGVVLTKNIL